MTVAVTEFEDLDSAAAGFDGLSNGIADDVHECGLACLPPQPIDRLAVRSSEPAADQQHRRPALYPWLRP